MATSRFQALETANHEATDIGEAMEIRKLVERAKASLVGRCGYTDKEAQATVQKMGQDGGDTMKKAALAILAATEAL